MNIKSNSSSRQQRETKMEKARSGVSGPASLLLLLLLLPAAPKSDEGGPLLSPRFPWSCPILPPPLHRDEELIRIPIQIFTRLARTYPHSTELNRTQPDLLKPKYFF